MKSMILKTWTGNSRKPITRIYKASGRRFIKSVVPNSIKKGYVKVSYGKKICNFNCLCEFYNDGEYTSRADLLKAIRDFLEEE